MDKLSEKERKYINDNWLSIKSLAEKEGTIKFNESKLNYLAVNYSKYIELTIIKETNILIKIFKNAKVITFKYKSDNEIKEKKELISEPLLIIYFTKHYKMDHPVYTKKENNNEKNISVDLKNCDDIFNDPKINEIFDDRLDLLIKKEEFISYKNKIKIDVSDYYDKFSINQFSHSIKEDKYIESEIREELSKFITELELIEQCIIILAGCEKIGLSFTILQNLKFTNILYINFEEFFELKKTTDKRKYLFSKFFNIFNNYIEYKEFINNYIFNVRGYDNILELIKSYIILIKDNYITKYDSYVYICLDNYDDYLVGNIKLCSKFIEDIYRIIKNITIKIIIIGKGLYISKMLINYFYKPINIENYVLIKHFNTLQLGLEDMIHEYYKNQQVNEIEIYSQKKLSQNPESLLYNLITIKNLSKVIDENYQNELPFQFFTFQKDNDKLKINFKYEDLIDKINKKIRECVAKLNQLDQFSNLSLREQGFILKELIVSLFMNNKTFKNLIFPDNNIIEVNKIYNLEEEDIPKKINKLNLSEGPILIIQKEDGEIFDLGIVIKENDIDYFIAVQIGINIKNSDINNYLSKIKKNEKIILDNIILLTKIKIEELRFIIILDKEYQSKLTKEYTDIYDELLKQKKIQKTQFEQNIKETKRNKMNNFNSNYGIKCCENNNVSYFLFSIKNFKFYQDERIIDNFKVSSFKCIEGFQYFICNEYNLIPLKSKSQVLEENEKQLLLDAMKKILPNLVDIDFSYSIGQKIPLLVATPFNCGILSVTDEIKVFTYYNGQFIHYLLTRNTKDCKLFINQYNQDNKLFNNEYNNDLIKNKYFGKFSFMEKKDEEINNEGDNISYYQNNLRYLQKKRKTENNDN